MNKNIGLSAFSNIVGELQLKLNPKKAEKRIIGIRTFVGKQGNGSFLFDLPHYECDKVMGRYGEFLNASNSLGEYLVSEYSNVGEYSYKLEVTLLKGGKYKTRLLHTDNPRCILGDKSKKKEVHNYIKPSVLTVRGCKINGNIKNEDELLYRLGMKMVAVHSNIQLKRMIRIIHPDILKVGDTVYKFTMDSITTLLPSRLKLFPKYNLVRTRYVEGGKVKVELLDSKTLEKEEWKNSIVDYKEVVIGYTLESIQDYFM